MEVKKRESWETEETKYFLHLIRERQVMKCLDSKKFRADEIFKYLEKSRHEKGYKKNWKQMQTRFKTLRRKLYIITIVIILLMCNFIFFIDNVLINLFSNGFITLQNDITILKEKWGKADRAIIYLHFPMQQRCQSYWIQDR